MNINEIKNIVNSKQYDFLQSNESLGKNIILLGLGGSYAYGMNTESSDLDIRGCALNKKEEILLGNYFEQIEDKNTDTVIYSLNKLVSLLANCNPNVIEILGLKPEHYLYVSPIGQELLNNKHMFLSKRCINSFGGYANQQLRRLQNAMAHDGHSKMQRELHILNTIKNMKHHFMEVYPVYDDLVMKFYIDKSQREDMETEIFIDYNLKHFPLIDYKGIMSEVNTVINEYSKLNKRNNKKDIKHLAKHMAHLLRLYMMAIDILEKGEIITYREDEHDLLMNVRNGDYLSIASDEVVEKVQKDVEKLREEFKNREFESDFEYDLYKEMLNHDIDKLMTGIYTLKSEFKEILDSYEKRFEIAKQYTLLPDMPDYDKINRFVMNVNEKIVKEEL